MVAFLNEFVHVLSVTPVMTISKLHGVNLGYSGIHEIPTIKILLFKLCKHHLGYSAS